MAGKLTHGQSERNGRVSGHSRSSSAKTKFSATTSNKNGGQTDDVVDDALFQVDKVLYNLYGDIASALRNCEMSGSKETPRSILDGDSSYNSIISNTSCSSRNLLDRQSEAILDCLKAFMSEQSNIFTEAIVEGLRVHAVDLITLPAESQLSQINEIISGENRLIDNLDPYAPFNSHLAAIENPQQSQRSENPVQPSQRSAIFSEFAIPSSVRSVGSQLSVISSDSKSLSQRSYRTIGSVYETPQNSLFEFDRSSPRPATPRLDNNWSQCFNGASAQSIMQEPNFYNDQRVFISPLSPTCPSLRSSAMVSNNNNNNNRNEPNESSHSLFNISTQINPHFGFDSVRVRGASGSNSTVHSNNSKNKYAKPFKSIQSDSKLGKSISKHSRTEVMNTPLTKETPATIGRTHATAAAMRGFPEREFDFQRSKTAHNVNRQIQSKQRIEKQNRDDKFTEFFQSEKFQRLHRIANSVCDASVSKIPPASNEEACDAPDPRTVTVNVSLTNDNNENSSIAANASSDATSSASKRNADALSAPLSPYLDTCVLPPPPGF